MFKILKRSVFIGLVLVLLLQCFACGRKKEVNNDIEDTQNLNITLLERGYGSAFLDNLKSEFEKQNPGVKVNITKTALGNVLDNSFRLGSKYNDCDLYFNVGVTSYAEYHKLYKYFSESDCAYYSFDEIINENIPGEGLSIKQKIQSQIMDTVVVDVDGEDKCYFLPWASAIQGLVVNNTILNEIYGSNIDSIKYNTTNEFFNLCKDIKQKGYTPLIYPGQLNYWNSLYNVWWAQYEGYETHKMFQYAKGYDEISGDYIYSASIFKQQGRLESLSVMEKLLSQNNNLHDTNVNDYTQYNYTTLQTQFLYSSMAGQTSSRYVFYPNGDWLMQESEKGQRADNIDMIKTPVISSITDKLSVIKRDEDLSLVIDYIDGKITEEELFETESIKGLNKTLLEKDINRVREARQMVYSQGYSHLLYSPYYANAKTLIKKFLQFMYSNEGLKIYAESGNGGFIPASIELNTESFSDFGKSVYYFVNNSVFVNDCKKSILFAGNYILDGKVNNGIYEALLGAKPTSAYYKTAQQIFEAEQYTDNQFNLALQNAGILK